LKHQGLFGCQPCQDGYYAAAGGSMQGCKACPRGKYASQTKGLVDYYQCPNANSTRISFYALPGSSKQPSLSSSPASCSAPTVTSGATACTSCPASAPYTWQEGSKSISDCRKCAEGQFFDATTSRCTACSTPCQVPNDFETVPCTHTTNRRCAYCELREEYCKLDGEYPTGSCPGPIDAERACARCTNKPEGSTSYYIAPAGKEATESKLRCAWRCVDGYFADPGTSECKKCTEMTADTCKPGFLPTPCSSELNMDASCSRPCDVEALNKPGGNLMVDNADETSEWVWTTYAQDGVTVVQNPTGGTDGKPNVGCMWKCKPGYMHRVLDVGVEGAAKIEYCVKIMQ